MPGFDDQVLWCSNQNFSDPTGTQFRHLGEFTAAGDIAIGTGGVAPAQQIAVGHLVGLGGITIGYSSPNITIDGTGAGTPLTVHTDGSDAVESAGAISIVGAGGITTSGSGSTITIASLGAGLSWSVITADQTAVANSGYFCNKGSLLTLTLPSTTAVGDVIAVVNINGAAFSKILSANPGTIHAGSSTCTANTGSLTSTALGDTVFLVAQTTASVWYWYGVSGSWTVA